MHSSKLDIIGDIHGHADVLEQLLLELGYKRELFHNWSHPDGRKILFLGDYIDRGPKIRETIHIVRSMCENDNAIALMGNHEHNAVCMETLGEDGEYLRERSEKNVRTTTATRNQFQGKTKEWLSHIEWFKSLHFALDFGDLRTVHACWDKSAFETLQGKSLADHEVLMQSSNKNHPYGKSVLRLLNGPELHLPPGVEYPDKEGTLRNTVRVRWWDVEKGMNLGECIFPKPNLQVDKTVEQRHVNQINFYPQEDPLVCFGHYWLDPDRNPMIKNNIVCLDLSIAKHGKLACLRNSTNPEGREFVVVTPQKTISHHSQPHLT